MRSWLSTICCKLREGRLRVEVDAGLRALELQRNWMRGWRRRKHGRFIFETFTLRLCVFF